MVGNRSTPEKTHDFQQSVDILFSHEDWVQVTLWDALLRIESATSELKSEWLNHFTTEAPVSDGIFYSKMVHITVLVRLLLFVVAVVFVVLVVG